MFPSQHILEVDSQIMSFANPMSSETIGNHIDFALRTTGGIQRAKLCLSKGKTCKDIQQAARDAIADGASRPQLSLLANLGSLSSQFRLSPVACLFLVI